MIIAVNWTAALTIRLTSHFLQAVNSFAGELSVQMLCGQDENLNFSPVSLYMALSLAASGAKGATQEELLAALGLSGKSMDYLATQSSHLFQRLYRDNEVGQLHVANSIWLRQDSDFREALLIGRRKILRLPLPCGVLQIPKRPRR